MKRPAGMVIKRKAMSTLVKRADKALSVKVAVEKPKTMSKLAKRADKALPGMVAEAKEEVAVDEPMTSKVAKAETTPNIEVDGGKAARRCDDGHRVDALHPLHALAGAKCRGEVRCARPGGEAGAGAEDMGAGR